MAMVSQYVISYPALSLLSSVGWEMSISHLSVMMLCSWGVKVGMVHYGCGLTVWVAGKSV